MGRELFNFAAVYFMVSLGFGIGFFGLFSYADSYNTYGYTYVTLIQNTLGDFDIDAFHSENLITNALGIVLIICFVIMMNVVLMNVLIAQMTRYVLIMLMLMLLLLLDDDLILLSLSSSFLSFVCSWCHAISMPYEYDMITNTTNKPTVRTKKSKSDQISNGPSPLPCYWAIIST